MFALRDRDKSIPDTIPPTTGVSGATTKSVDAVMIAATRGIGHFIMSASQFLATDYVFVGIGIIALCAFAFSFAMRLIERWLVPWRGQS